MLSHGHMLELLVRDQGIEWIFGALARYLPSPPLYQEEIMEADEEEEEEQLIANASSLFACFTILCRSIQ